MSIKPLIYNRRNAEEARDLLESLQSPDRLSISAIENAVTSVNGMIGDVIIDTSGGGDWQPRNTILTELSTLDTSGSGMLWDDGGDFSISPVSAFVKGLFSAPNDAYFRGMLGLGDSAVLDTNVPNGIPTLDPDGKLSSSVFPFTLSAVATTGSYNDLTDKPALFSGNYADLSGKPVLFSGSYTDLTNKPVIPAAQIQSDWNQSNTSSADFIKNKPTIPTVNYPVVSVNGKTGAVVLSYTDVGAAATVHTHSISDITGLQTALDGKLAVGASIPYSSLTGAPTLSAVATSGSYADLTNKPTLFSGSYTDLTNKPALFDGTWASLTGKPTLFDGTWTSLTGKPTFATVATSGAYADLSGKPTIPAAQVNSDWNATSGVAQILNKPTLATVAVSGSYTDLSNKPTIPAAQVQSDWNASAGLGAILNKPTIPSTTTQISEGTNLYYTDARVGTYLTNNGYKKVEIFQGTTNASGVYQVTFANTYPVPPHVNPVILNGAPNMVLTVSNITTTGCTMTVVQRSSVTLLSVEVLLAATVAVSGATVGVLVVAK